MKTIIQGNIKSMRDWTYYSKKTPGAATTIQNITFFDAIDPSFCNIAAPNQFPSKLYFKLMKIGFQIFPQDTSTIALATLQQAMNSIVRTGRLSISIVNEVYLDMPISKIIKRAWALGITSGGMQEFSSGEDVLLNQPIEFDKGASFSCNLSIVSGIDISTLIPKLEVRMSGFLVEVE
jgi:hypothetical protein